MEDRLLLKNYSVYETDGTAETLDFLSWVCAHLKTSVTLSFNYTKEVPMILINNSYWIPIGSKAIVYYNENSHIYQLWFILADNSVIYIDK